jgi:N-hydroxyarylamine O-acetyltransferase
MEHGLAEAIDLEAYFARIGYSGSRAAQLATLRALHAAHPSAIPFENLDPVLGRPVPLDAASLTAKLVRGGRGGYCYEQNGLFMRVLAALGFNVVGLAARVLRGHVEPDAPPRSHMLLKLDIDGEEFISDVGFGLLTLTAPVRLNETRIQETPHGEFRVIPGGDSFELHARADGAWQALYRFSLEEQLLQDYEAPNWYRATHPDSPFVRNLMVARALPGRRLGLLNNQFSVRPYDGGLSRRTLTSASEMVGVLEREFGITLPLPRSDVERALERFVHN